MLKNIISPVQAWLLSQGRCVGCGRELQKPKGKDYTRIDCQCGRIYMYDALGKRYRRATVDEIK